MKLTEALKAVTKISPDEDQNLQNYLKSVNFISNLYRFHYMLKDCIPVDQVEYLPTFKDCYLSEELGLETVTEENELRLIEIKSPLLLVDENVERITAKFDNICNNIIHENDTMTFYLK